MHTEAISPNYISTSILLQSFSFLWISKTGGQLSIFVLKNFPISLRPRPSSKLFHQMDDWCLAEIVYLFINVGLTDSEITFKILILLKFYYIVVHNSMSWYYI